MITKIAGRCTGILYHPTGVQVRCLYSKGKFEVAEGGDLLEHTKCTECHCKYNGHGEFFRLTWCGSDFGWARY